MTNHLMTMADLSDNSTIQFKFRTTEYINTYKKQKCILNKILSTVITSSLV